MKADRRFERLIEPMLQLRSDSVPAFASGLHHAVYAAEVTLALRPQRFDVAHVINFSQFISLLRFLNPTTATVLHMHCEWLTQLDRSLVQRRLRHADAIVGCSNYVVEKIRSRFPECAPRCQTVFNGVDARAFSPSPQKAKGEGRTAKRLLFVGRVSPEKGVHVLVDALAELADSCPRARLDIVGEVGPCPRDFIVGLSDDPKVRRLAAFYDGKGYWWHLQERVRSLTLRSRIRFHGLVPHHQLPGLYRKADVVVNPSLSEAFGMSLIEAMATETPVVATRVGGAAEIVIDGKTGLLVEPDDSHALAEAISRVVSDPDLARSMGTAGRQRACEHFTWDRIVQGLFGLYQQVVR